MRPTDSGQVGGPAVDAEGRPTPVEAGEPRARAQAGLWWLAAALVSLGMSSGSLWAVTLALPAAAAALWWRPARAADRLLAVGLVALCATAALVNVTELVALAEGWRNALAVLLAVAIVVAYLARSTWQAAAAVAVAGVIVLGLAIPLGSHHIDVAVFNHGAGVGLWHGQNPYGLVFHSIYSPAQEAAFYGHGVVVDGVIQSGYPYPPVAAVVMAVGEALGDFRLGVLLVLAAGAAALTRVAGRRGLLLLVIPGVVSLFAYAWTEPLSVGLLALATASLLRRSSWAPVWLGLLLVSKQYFAVTVPLLILLLPAFGMLPGGRRRSILTLVGAGALATVPFLLWDPAAFWRSVVEFQFRQPFRPDSTSWLVSLVGHAGWPPPGTWGALPLGAGIATAALLAWRAPRTPAGFSGSLGIVLLLTVLLSKQAFLNYYSLVVGAFMIAAVVLGGQPGRDSTRGE